jgi:hypothetical protein
MALSFVMAWDFPRVASLNDLACTSGIEYCSRRGGKAREKVNLEIVIGNASTEQLSAIRIGES